MYSKRVERVSNCRWHWRERCLTKTVYISTLALDQVMRKKLGEITRGGNIVVGEISICRLALCKTNFLEKGRTETHNHRAFVLQFCAWTIDHASRIDGGVELDHLEFPCFFIDTDLGCPSTLMPMA